MTTDVSAGALAAGNGALQGAGQKQGPNGKAPAGAGFAVELGASEAGQGANASGTPPRDGARSDGPVRGAAAGIRVSLDAPLVDDVPQGPAGPAMSGAPLPEGGEGAEPVAADDTGEPAEDILSEDGLVAALVLPVAEPAPAVPAAVVPQVSVDGLAGAGAGVREADRGGRLPLQGGEGAGGRMPGGALPGQGVSGLPEGLPKRDAGTAGGAGQVPATGAGMTGTSGEMPDVTASGSQAAGPAERRWQSELPRELRAQTAPLPQASAVSPQAQGAAGGLMDALASLPAGEAETDLQAKPSGPQNGPVAAQQTGTPAIDVAQADGNADVAAQGRQAGSTTEAAAEPEEPVNAQVRAGAVSPAQSGADTTRTLRPDGAGMSQSLSGDAADADGKPMAPDAPAITDRSAERTTAGPAGAEDTLRPQARLAEGGAAAQAAAGPAPAAAMMTGDEADLAGSGADLSLTGEAGATSVRGGELTGAMRTESLQAPNQSQSAHVATQVAAEIARNLKNGQTRFQMRFDPPELGRVEVNMKVSSDGAVHAHLIVERPETLDMFLRDQRGLEKALEAAGLNPGSDNLQFSLKQDGGREFGSGDSRPDQGAGSGREQAEGGPAEVDPMLEEIVRMTLAQQRGGLDMKV
ncbi:flagellar hook-length control protein FliK [Labrenzia sp. 011]|uniref:flagellar hook-length control protein FliK n=1 Tax=Labrenzia sp. 011 TaxID=2171494 RepID=UPI001403DFCD|nr:flagellar hook-length control protein FliK [Labrenzia sp. 011]